MEIILEVRGRDLKANIDIVETIEKSEDIENTEKPEEQEA